MVTTSTVGSTIDDDLLNLPAREIDSDAVGAVGDDVPVGIALPEDEGDPFDDSVASDLPLDVEIDTEAVEASVIGDDDTGIDGIPLGIGIDLDESSESLLDPDLEREGLNSEDMELGIDSVPHEADDGGVEGLHDPTAEQIDTGAFPELVSDEEDGDELDVGIDIDIDDAPRIDDLPALDGASPPDDGAGDGDGA